MALNEKAMLVRLNISQWYNKTLDKKVVEEVAANHNVTDREDRYVKTLIARSALRGVTTIISQIREFHYRHTLPWLDDSSRILPSAHFMKYREGMQRLREQFDQEVEHLVANFPNWVDHARKNKGGLFDERQYPNPSALRQHFGVRISIMPFPNVQDFRISVSEDQLAEIKREAEAHLNEAMQGAIKHIRSVLHERVWLLYQALKDPERIFQNRVFHSLHETTELAKTLNVTNNLDVQLAIDSINAAIQDVTPEQVRASDALRHEVAGRLLPIALALQEKPQ